MSLYQQSIKQDYGSVEVHPETVVHQSPPNNIPSKIIFIISRDLTEEELNCLQSHGKVEFYTPKIETDTVLSPQLANWKYMIFDIRTQHDRQWLINNIAYINEYVVIITSDSQDEPWLEKLIKEGCVTNILKKLPIIMEKESFDKRIINSLWIPKRKCCCWWC